MILNVDLQDPHLDPLRQKGKLGSGAGTVGQSSGPRQLLLAQVSLGQNVLTELVLKSWFMPLPHECTMGRS
ncbi:hypothetical protein Y1Q_0003850 [Alligator mississippiensis]|uniref:Uncharacterized protein n=1 Tax=Alligator mississippiensis TaxID=8496 RepID=A0A151MNH9_ALLMI|nr:hypothetical protein Y1Q_0003850 [Alligator mississippiensis]